MNLRGFWARLRGTFRRARRDGELAAELESHLQLHIDDNVARGMTPAEARRQALIDLGGVEPTKEAVRAQRGLPLLEEAAQDARYALRAMRKNPGFALVVIVTLGLGIGANTAIFSVVDAVLLRPLPYPEADRIVQVWHTPPQEAFPGRKTFSVSPANYLDWRDQSRSFESLAAFADEQVSYSGGDRPELILGARVMPELFAVLRARPMLGRTFNPDEIVPGNDKVVLVSHRFWQTHLGGDPGVVGQSVRLSGESYTIAGVMPPRFQFPARTEMWLPLAWSDEERSTRGIHDYWVVGRLAPGASLAGAQAEMTAISRRLEEAYPADDKGWGALLVPLREQTVGEVEPALLVLLVAVSFVLLISCANVANLVLARTLARKREIALRAALGASRGRIVRQILAENLVLALIGGGLGLLVGTFGLDAIRGLVGEKLPRAAEIAVDGRVLLFTFVLSIVTGLLAALVPALRLTHVDLADSLKQGLGKAGSDTGGNRTRGGLVVAEVALSLILLVGAGLMLRTLALLRGVNPGFDTRGVLTMHLALSDLKYDAEPAQIAFYERALERIRALPGVAAAGAVSDLPTTGGSTQPFAIEGRPQVQMSDQPEVAVRVATPGYFETLRIPLLRGRPLRPSDAAGQPHATVISESMARQFWPGEDAVGKRLTLTFRPDAPWDVVGIVGDVKLNGLAATAPTPVLYVPHAQRPRHWMALVIRAPRPASLAPAVAAVIRGLDPELPLVDAMTLETLLDDSLAQQRLAMVLLSVFAGFALLLAAIGIYSVLSYAVRRRMQEIGIRVALGARPWDVLWLVIGHGLRLTAAGLVLGGAGALALSHLIAGLLFGVAPTDPTTFGAVAALLLAIALLACYLPARRAVRVDPMVSMRYE